MLLAFRFAVYLPCLLTFVSQIEDTRKVMKNGVDYW